jgi:hypothetical protein
MRHISIRTVARTLVRFMSGSAVRIALSATLTTPHPATAALAAGNVVAAAAAVAADRPDGGDTQPVPQDPSPVPGAGCIGPGWG